MITMTLKFGRKKITLSLEEVRNLHDELTQIFGAKVTSFDPLFPWKYSELPTTTTTSTTTATPLTAEQTSGSTVWSNGEAISPPEMITEIE